MFPQWTIEECVFHAAIPLLKNYLLPPLHSERDRENSLAPSQIGAVAVVALEADKPDKLRYVQQLSVRQSHSRTSRYFSLSKCSVLKLKAFRQQAYLEDTDRQADLFKRKRAREPSASR